jgi:hypothetical protein
MWRKIRERQDELAEEMTKMKEEMKGLLAWLSARFCQLGSQLTPVDLAPGLDISPLLSTWLITRLSLPLSAWLLAWLLTDFLIDGLAC